MTLPLGNRTYWWNGALVRFESNNYEMDELSWYWLFNWASLEGRFSYHKSTPAQSKQQKLFQQLGTLHRTRANLHNIINDFGKRQLWTANSTLMDAYLVIGNLIDLVNVDMKNITPK